MDEHLTQGSFRKILEAMTFPGKTIPLEKSSTEVPPLYSQTLLVCQTLLDSEVTFAVLQNQQVSQSIHAYTGSHETKLEEADFIVIPQMVSNEALIQLKSVKTGDLRDPQKSATLFIEVDSLTEGTAFELSGPGIKDKTVIHSNLSKEFIETRALLNGEYPLGIDTLFIDRDGLILGLPRTTKVMEVK
ncbi:phosphonate C-P lyase system protein PhnH [Lysinibacillus yapensis]|uniref:Phosphonate C-P lyase system protein PhnH n=1 Tax=Ureibacillus yapensis TaxID=2304605 RepID=A0A396S9G4_9BACL|nr:phosphonate C-P lyase system protein PhnH [Lysinibacillus yapensis]RHW35775.1 phosphonate C-P lyase system protein PhnH [Lysinibacillus yapensis]